MFLGFNKSETKFVLATLLIIMATTLLNLRVSYRKSRDAQRKNDVRAIHDALQAYNNEFGSYPISTSDGLILACDPIITETTIIEYKPCQWYEDGLFNPFKKDAEPYLARILGDPRQGQGRSYFYISTGKHFQILASLESEKEAEFSFSIKARNLPCGKYICNFGRSDSEKTPLDKSLLTYENELRILEEERLKIIYGK